MSAIATHAEPSQLLHRERERAVSWEQPRDKALHINGLDITLKFIPDALSRVAAIDFLSHRERRLLSQIQGRSYVNFVALLDGLLNLSLVPRARARSKMQIGSAAPLAGNEKDILRHQRFFCRIDAMIDRSLPCGYRAVMDAATLASSVIAKSPWSVLALSFHMALTTQAHYKEGFVSDREISEAFKNFLRDRWRRESRRVIFDGIEWARIDANLSANQRDVAVDDFIALMLAIDDMLQVQCDQDVEYFVDINPRELGGARKERLRAALLAAYRWQFIETGLRVPRFSSALRNFLSAEQFQRLHGALHGLTVNSWTH